MPDPRPDDPARDLRDALDALAPLMRDRIVHWTSPMETFTLTWPNGRRLGIPVYSFDEDPDDSDLHSDPEMYADICLGWAFAEAARRGWELHGSGTPERADFQVCDRSGRRMRRFPRGQHPSSPAVAALRALTSAALGGGA